MNTSISRKLYISLPWFGSFIFFIISTSLRIFLMLLYFYIIISFISCQDFFDKHSKLKSVKIIIKTLSEKYIRLIDK